MAAACLTAKEDRKEYSREYYLRNKERHAKKCKEYREKNAEKLLEYRRKYIAENKNAVAETIKKWKAKNPERFKAIVKGISARRTSCPLKNMSHRIRTQTRNALLGKFFGKKAESRLGLGKVALKEMFNMQEHLTVDHICPLGQGKTVEEVVKLAHYSNIRVVPLKENTDKKDKKTPEGELLCRKLLGREWI